MSINKNVWDAAKACLENKSFENFVNQEEGGPIGTPNLYFWPSEIAEAFILKPNYVKTTIPDSMRENYTPEEIEILQGTIDSTTLQLVLLKAMGYTRWNEIRDLNAVRILNIEGMDRCKIFFLKEVGVLE